MPIVFVAVLMYDGLADTVQAFKTREKANAFLFETMQGNEHGLFFNDALEFDPDPREMIDSPYSGTRIWECKMDLED